MSTRGVDLGDRFIELMAVVENAYGQAGSAADTADSQAPRLDVRYAGESVLAETAGISFEGSEIPIDQSLNLVTPVGWYFMFSSSLEATRKLTDRDQITRARRTARSDFEAEPDDEAPLEDDEAPQKPRLRYVAKPDRYQYKFTGEAARRASRVITDRAIREIEEAAGTELTMHKSL